MSLLLHRIFKILCSTSVIRYWKRSKKTSSPEVGLVPTNWQLTHPLKKFTLFFFTLFSLYLFHFFFYFTYFIYFILFHFFYKFYLFHLIHFIYFNSLYFCAIIFLTLLNLSGSLRTRRMNERWTLPWLKRRTPF